MDIITCTYFTNYTYQIMLLIDQVNTPHKSLTAAKCVHRWHVHVVNILGLIAYIMIPSVVGDT